MKIEELVDSTKSMLFEMVAPIEKPILQGISTNQIRKIELNLGFFFSDEVIQWYNFCNGALTSPGGLYGFENTYIDIANVYSCYPFWIQNKWLPLAGDGHGNHYICLLDPNSKYFSHVFFVDTSHPNELCYAVGSNVWYFFFFLFRNELGEKRWPFDMDYISSIDPNFIHVES